MTNTVVQTIDWIVFWMAGIIGLSVGLSVVFGPALILYYGFNVSDFNALALSVIIWWGLVVGTMFKYSVDEKI